jgi:hypothetical protein
MINYLSERASIMADNHSSVSVSQHSLPPTVLAMSDSVSSEPSAHKRPRTDSSYGNASGWSLPPSVASSSGHSRGASLTNRSTTPPLPKLIFSDEGLGIARERTISEYFPSYANFELRELYEIKEDELASIPPHKSQKFESEFQYFISFLNDAHFLVHRSNAYGSEGPI